MRPDKMLNIGEGVFIRVSDDNSATAQPCPEVDAPALYPATITGVNEGGCVVQVDEAIVLPTVGEMLAILFEHDKTFHEQHVRLDAILDEPATDRTIRLGVTLIDEPRRVDARACHRIRTVECGLLADFADFPNCPVVDISPTGFSIIAPPGARIGDTVKVVLRHNDETFEGCAAVQSELQINEDCVRYGMRSISRKHGGGDLIRGQQHLTMMVQQEQFAIAARASA